MGSEYDPTVEDKSRQVANPERVEPGDLPRGTTVDRYVLIDKIGQGGMGVVYSAYDHALHRRVAVKLVKGHKDDRTQAQLLAEARTMAQLSHPALVTVYDVGEFEGQVFLAMEFVEGVTLRKWQTREARSWRDVVAMYCRVGEGLAFAHDAGVIHRDLKPDNVIVDESDRPHITDFGLAKVDPRAIEPSPMTSLITKHTISGKTAGTPGYMSPQQLLGEPTDERTDQYAFCASLFEALHGGLPIHSPPVPKEVPRAILAAIQRGLENDPRERWPSMRALLDVLAPREPVRRRYLIGAFVVVPVAIATWMVVRGGGPEQSCDAPQAQEAWHAARDQVIARLTRQGGHPEELATALDHWTESWTDMARASCRATASGAQSAQLLDLRARCLDHTLDVVRSLIELARHADPQLAAHADSIPLPQLEPCADAPGLLGNAALPPDLVRRAVIADLGKRLAEIQALVDADSQLEALRRLDALAAPVHAVGYPPLELELYSVRTYAELARGASPAAAAASAWRAIAVEPTRADYTMGALWLDLVWIVGEMQHQPEQAIELGRVAETIVDRVQDKSQLALLDYRLGAVLADAARYDEAIARFERSRSLSEQLHDDHEVVTTLQGEALAERARGDRKKQIALCERAVQIANQMPHSNVLLANLLSTLAVAYLEDGRTDDGIAILQRADIIIGDRRDDPGVLLSIHANLGNAWEERGYLSSAESEFRQAVEVARTMLAPDTSETEVAWYNLGQIQNKRGEYRGALVSLSAALDILQKAPAAAAVSDDYEGPGSLARAIVIARSGLHQSSEAVAAAEQCLALAHQISAGDKELAQAHIALANALWESGARERARATMRQAGAELAQSGASADEANEWLAAH